MDRAIIAAGPLSRRRSLALAAAALAAGAAPLRSRADEPAVRIEAVVFDALTIFDARPVFALAETLFPESGAALAAAWRSRLFEYQWLHALAGRYADFVQAADEALVFASRQLALELPAAARQRLVRAFFAIDAWPDVEPALRRLRDAGVRRAFLSNMTPALLQAGIRNARLDGLFDQVLSTDTIRTHKPDPRAYRLAVDAFGLDPRQMAFAAFAGWDVAGARWFGYPTFWVNRLRAPAEALGVEADATGPGLDALVAFVTSRRSASGTSTTAAARAAR